MAMNYRVRATLDTESEAALEVLMRRHGWTKSQAVREAIWAMAKSKGIIHKPARRPRKQSSNQS